jgi:hypothetical protein
VRELVLISGKVTDPRDSRWVRHRLSAILAVGDRVMCLTRKATALVHLGKSDEGYTEALQAAELAEQIDSTRLGDHLRTFDLTLAGHGSTQLTSDFRQRAAQMLGSSPPVSRT